MVSEQDVRIDFSANPKQAVLYRLVKGACRGENDYRIFHYGGAFRGGKSFSEIGLGYLLNLQYPKTKGYIIRATSTRLAETSMEVAKKITRGADVSWREYRGVPIMTMFNGTTIRFLSENLDGNPDLDHFKGEEMSWIIFEQIEEIAEKTYHMGLSRLGSNNESKCPAFCFTNFNPAFNWVKEKIYDRAKASKQLDCVPDSQGRTDWLYEISPHEIFIEAFPEDNPFNTEEQWRAWDKLDPETSARFVKGRWEIEVQGRFFSAFTRAKHVRECKYDRGDILRLSFDFNVDPMTAIAYQTDQETYFRVLKEFRVMESNSYQICQQVKAEFETDHVPLYMVTGDPSGRNRTRGIAKPLSDYDIIREGLYLGPRQIVAPIAHSRIGVQRIMVNSVLTHFPEISIDPSCEWLIKDMEFCLKGLDSDGEITKQKTGINPYMNISNKELFHLGDCFLYGAETDLRQWMKVPQS